MFKALEKIAYIKGTSVELVALDAIRVYLGIVKDVDDHYRFKFEYVVEETRRLIESAASKGIIKVKKVKPEKIASSLGKLITLIKDSYGYIPGELLLDDIKAEELERLFSVLTKITGRSSVGGRKLNPITYIVSRVMEVRGVARAFGIEVVEEGGSVKAIKFNNINLLYMYYGYGTRFLRRRIKR